MVDFAVYFTGISGGGRSIIIRHSKPKMPAGRAKDEGERTLVAIHTVQALSGTKQTSLPGASHGISIMVAISLVMIRVCGLLQLQWDGGLEDLSAPNRPWKLPRINQVWNHCVPLLPMFAVKCVG